LGLKDTQSACSVSLFSLRLDVSRYTIAIVDDRVLDDNVIRAVGIPVAMVRIEMIFQSRRVSPSVSVLSHVLAAAVSGDIDAVEDHI
jgi:hypothetical protein